MPIYFSTIFPPFIKLMWLLISLTHCYESGYLCTNPKRKRSYCICADLGTIDVHASCPIKVLNHTPKFLHSRWLIYIREDDVHVACTKRMFDETFIRALRLLPQKLNVDLVSKEVSHLRIQYYQRPFQMLFNLENLTQKLIKTCFFKFNW